MTITYPVRINSHKGRNGYLTIYHADQAPYRCERTATGHTLVTFEPFVWRSHTGRMLYRCDGVAFVVVGPYWPAADESYTWDALTDAGGQSLTEEAEDEAIELLRYHVAFDHLIRY